jgi:phosphoribosyl 1,2-cyclic phosphodiesterase
MNIVSSGSKGNSTVIWDGEDAIVIDFGISVKRFQARASEIGLEYSNISIFLTHEHSDHASGISAARNKLNADLYLRPKVKESLGINGTYPIRETTVIGNFIVEAIPISHDAIDPVGFIIKYNDRKISLFSDLGFFPMEQVSRLNGSNLIAMEANHDVDMLRTGSYPPHLKKRIQSTHGHLSNLQASEVLEKCTDSSTDLVLIHLSDENNTPDTAYTHVRDHLQNREIGYKSLECARQLVGSSTFEV